MLNLVANNTTNNSTAQATAKVPFTLLQSVTFAMTLIFFYNLVAKLLKTYKVKYLHKTGAGIFIGMIAECYMSYFHPNTVIFGFSETVFTYVLLPAIMFSDGFNAKPKDMWASQAYIYLFGLFGNVLQYFILANVHYYVWTQWLGGAYAKFFTDYSGLLITATFVASKSITALNIVEKNESRMYPLILGEALFNDVLMIAIFNSVSSKCKNQRNLLIKNANLKNVKAVFNFTMNLGKTDLIQYPNVFYRYLLGSLVIGLVGGLFASWVMKILLQLSTAAAKAQAKAAKVVTKESTTEFVEAPAKSQENCTACGQVPAKETTTKEEIVSAVGEILIVYALGWIVYELSETQWTYVGGFNGPCAIVMFAIIFKRLGYFNVSKFGKDASTAIYQTGLDATEGLLFVIIGLEFKKYGFKFLFSSSIGVVLLEFMLILVTKFLVIYVVKTVILLLGAEVFKSCSKTWYTKMQQVAELSPKTFSEVKIVLFSGLFKGVISFALITKIEELTTLEDGIRAISKENAENAMSFVYALVIFTNIGLGAVLPCFLEGWVKIANTEWKSQLGRYQKLTDQLQAERSTSCFARFLTCVSDGNFINTLETHLITPEQLKKKKAADAKAAGTTLAQEPVKPLTKSAKYHDDYGNVELTNYEKVTTNQLNEYGEYAEERLDIKIDERERFSRKKEVRKQKYKPGFFEEVEEVGLDFVRKVERNVERKGREFEKDVERKARELEKDVKRGYKEVEKDVRRGYKEVEKDVRRGYKEVEKDVRREGKEIERDVRRVGKEIEKDVRREVKEHESKERKERKSLERKESRRERKERKERSKDREGSDSKVKRKSSRRSSRSRDRDKSDHKSERKSSRRSSRSRDRDKSDNKVERRRSSRIKDKDRKEKDHKVVKRSMSYGEKAREREERRKKEKENEEH